MQRNAAIDRSGRRGRISRVLRRLSVASLMMALVGGHRTGAQAPNVPTPAAADSPAARSRVTRRPFDHRWHKRVGCTSCHGTGAQHRSIRVQAPHDCARCHHDARAERPCAACHTREQLPVGTRVAVAMALTVRRDTVVRELPFGHDRHESLACRECHGTPVTLDRDRACASCHDRHHRSAATCTSCHTESPRGRHQAAAHLSCAGSGCHAPALAPPPGLSRELCLVCHPGQRTHEPDGNCAACHRITGAIALSRTGDAPRREVVP